MCVCVWGGGGGGEAQLHKVPFPKLKRCKEVKNLEAEICTTIR